MPPKKKKTGPAKKKMSPEEEAALRAGEINDIDDDTYKVGYILLSVQSPKRSQKAGGRNSKGGRDGRAIPGWETASKLLLDRG